MQWSVNDGPPITRRPQGVAQGPWPDLRADDRGPVSVASPVDRLVPEP
jgi:hypothetical protein